MPKFFNTLDSNFSRTPLKSYGQRLADRYGIYHARRH